MEPPPSLFDSHCHLQDERLASALDSHLTEARRAGVARWVCCGSDEKDWARVSDLGRAVPGILPAFGLHPWYTESRSDAWAEQLSRHLSTWPGAPVGEIGLDHVIEPRREDDQLAVFAAQIEIASRLKRPVCIHCRRAWGALTETLPRLRELPRGFMIHSFSGAAELVPALADAGAYFSFSGSVTLSHNRRAHKACAAVPLDRLLIETDAPDIPPAPDVPDAPRPSINVPRNLVRVAEAVARIRGLELCNLALTTRQNAERFFNSPTVSSP
jgi:TatD DNase family protein